jgi:hypothetical protein
MWVITWIVWFCIINDNVRALLSGNVMKAILAAGLGSILINLLGKVILKVVLTRKKWVYHYRWFTIFDLYVDEKKNPSLLTLPTLHRLWVFVQIVSGMLTSIVRFISLIIYTLVFYVRRTSVVCVRVYVCMCVPVFMSYLINIDRLHVVQWTRVLSPESWRT